MLAIASPKDPGQSALMPGAGDRGLFEDAVMDRIAWKIQELGVGGGNRCRDKVEPDDQSKEKEI